VSALKVWGQPRSINEAWYERVKQRPAFKKWIDLPLT